MLQFLPGHVRFCPAICRNDPLISFRPIVDDRPSHLKIAVVTPSDHKYSPSDFLTNHNAYRLAEVVGGFASLLYGRRFSARQAEGRILPLGYTARACNSTGSRTPSFMVAKIFPTMTGVFSPISR